MEQQLPLTISNIHGEKITFLRIVTNDKGGQILELENELTPKAGPPMHVHYKQDECLTITQGRMGYQVLGGEKKFAGPGETVLFKAGVPHKFWNDGADILKCTGWATPPNTIVYFLTEVYRSSNENGGRPGAFDAAYLLNRYRVGIRHDRYTSVCKEGNIPHYSILRQTTGQTQEICQRA